MKKALVLATFLTGILVSAQSTWKADKAHSRISFDISHLLISEVTGNFTDFEVDAKADDSFKGADFTVDIKTASINTNNERRDGDLKSDNFFAAETYPSIMFKTTSFENTGDKTFKMTGDLTMHGVTKPVTLEGRVNGIITDERSQKLKAGLKLTGTLDRKDFGVGSKPVPVGDEVDITINLEMAQQ